MLMRDKLARTVATLAAIALLAIVARPSRGVTGAATNCPGTLTDGQVVRLSGADRRATAIAISRDSFTDDSAAAVVLARDNVFADALTGAPLAQLVNGPLLLSSPRTLTNLVSDELVRVLPSNGTVYLLGGTNALAPAVESAIKALGLQTRRLAGSTRYETAVKVAQQYPTTLDEAGIATGLDFADAVSLGAPAARDGFPILLVPGDEIPRAVRDYLEDRPALGALHLAGGTAVISTGVETGLASLGGVQQIKRYGGSDRYATSAEILAGFYGSDVCNVGLASGQNFPDGIAAGAHAGRRALPILLTELDAIPGPIRFVLEGFEPVVDGFVVYGGTAAITERTAASAEAMVEPASFLFWGDSGEANSHWLNIAGQIVSDVQAGDIDGAFMLGDNIYPVGASSATDPAFATLYENPFAQIISSLVIDVVLGNHDELTAAGQPELDYATTHPYWNLPARYYAQTRDHVRIVAMDSNQAFVDQTQLDFVARELAADPDALTRIVIAHHPVYSSGEHGVNNDEPWMRSLVEPVLIAGGTNFFLSGHDHDAEVLAPVSGINYIVSGAASLLRPITPSAQSLYASSTYHYSRLDLWYGHAVLTMYDEFGNPLFTYRYDLR